jgi:hypothetical protein
MERYIVKWRNKHSLRTIVGISQYSLDRAKYQVDIWGKLYPENLYYIEQA